MSVCRTVSSCMRLALGSILLAVTGCAVSGGPIAGSGTTTTVVAGTTPGSSTARVGLGGTVYGAQSPISGAAVTLWAAGTTGSYGTGASQIATTTTDPNGNFSFNTSPGVSPCTTGQLLYITSVGGYTGAGINQYAAVMAALPSPCSAATPNTYVVVNEVTTVASVTALQQFMSITPGGTPAWTIGAPTANVTGLTNAFTQVGNLAAIGTGQSGPTTATNTVSSVTYTTTIAPDSTKINTLADILAACINTTGTSVCTNLFADATPTGSVAPTDTIQAMYYLATNAGGVNLPNPSGEPAYLASKYIPGTGIPFNPYSATLTDWAVDVHWSGTNGTTAAASVAIDGSGNIWTSALTSSTTGLDVTEFNPAGQVLITPATTASVVGGWQYSTCATCTTPVNLGGTHTGDAIAIDTNGNAWATSWNGTTNTIASQIEAPVVKIAAGTGAASAYLVGFSPAGIVIDGSNDLFVEDGASTTAGRYYLSELQATPTPAYSTLDPGTPRSTSYYWSSTIDEAGYVWAAISNGETTIPRLTNTGANGTASTVGTTKALPSAVYYLAADASGNTWGSTTTTTSGATGLEYINVGGDTVSGIASPTVTAYPIGTNGSTMGGLYGPQGMAIDGIGNLWVVNSGANGTGISELAPSNNGTSLTPLSPSGTGVWGFLSGSSLSTPIGAAIDSSGDVWFKTKGGANLYYLAGAAAPVVTPIASMVGTSFIGERPGATLLASLTSSLSFNSLTASNQSQTATLTNTGTAPIRITGTTITGANASDFSVTGTTCGTTLAIGANCSITVTFTSATAGTFFAALNVNGNAVVTPASTNLTGAASASDGTINLQPGTTPPSGPTINFGTVVAPTTTAGQAVVLTNTGSTTMALTLGMTGTGANLFPQTTNCGSSLAAGASCFVSIKFGPKVPGSYSAALTVTNDAGTGQGASLSGTAMPFTISVNTTNASSWVIDNGAVTLTWNGAIPSMVLDGYTDQLTDGSQGLYMDNTGAFANLSIPTGGTAATSTTSCTAVGVTMTGSVTCGIGTGSTPYFDWAVTIPDTTNSGNAYTYAQHWLVFPNDPGVHVYTQLVHNSSDIAGGVGQMQWVFRNNGAIFTHTYEVNSSLGWLGGEDIPLPPYNDPYQSDPGRTVSNAVTDLHGDPNVNASYGRWFETKYDYAGYEYLHQAHGLYGPAPSGTTYGMWTVLPKLETLVGGPTKQNLWFTGNLDMIEAYSNHENNNLSLNTTAGATYNRLFGPYYVHINTLGTAYNQTGTPLASQSDMYADAISSEAGMVSNYDNVTPLVAAGYVPTSGRGSVSIQVNGVIGATHTAWAVLSDPNANHQFSSQGMQYWADISQNGTATISGVVPGTYRLSVYVLGQWGELREDGIVVTANNTTTVPAATFVPENFTTVNGVTSGETVFTIGTADRSSHEFFHGHNTVTGNDDREFYGAWNYWQDFAANQGAVIYYATAIGATPATNDLTKWNYTHWNSFNPGLFGGVFKSSDDTTDGYSAYPGQTYAGIGGVGSETAIPTYVASLPGASGTNGASTGIPAWQVYFATPSDIASYPTGNVELSVSLACGYSSYVVNLNPQAANVQRIWHYTNYSDCMIRSGLSGYTQWFVMEFPASALNQTPGGSNEITISMSSSGDGAQDDALRLELTNNTSNPVVTGWNDYTWITGTNYPGTGTSNSSGLYNNDAVPNP